MIQKIRPPKINQVVRSKVRNLMTAMINHDLTFQMNRKVNLILIPHQRVTPLTRDHLAHQLILALATVIQRVVAATNHVKFKSNNKVK